ncbi:MAG: MarR family transcriptional regulator [Marinobacter sp.]|uniref:MarR family winged helix-turn-helix transcriptional regulator n=1 Tax=Marinobacter sp. TaxID=50741 RepID=UPI00299F27E3|nr:MarR family transcriptional regulator [Marinobacter sp.]MDX1757070.1 MarR family transcriptional regulator [Marinobacter sp.]
MSLSQNASGLIKLANFQAKLLKKQDQWLAGHGISFKEFTIMLHLRQSPTRNMRRVDLAEAVGLSASGITRLLNPMQKIGLVDKEESARDARVSLVRLTEAGEALLADAEHSFNERTEAFMGLLTEGQRAALNELSATRI